METARISILSTLLVPLALWSACGGRDNNTPAGGSTGGGGSTSTGGTSGTGATTMGSGASGGTMGMSAGGAGGSQFNQPVVYDTSCPDTHFNPPPARDGG